MHSLTNLIGGAAAAALARGGAMRIRNKPLAISRDIVAHEPIVLLRQAKELLKVQSAVAILVGHLQDATRHTARHIRTLLVLDQPLHLGYAQVAVAVRVHLRIGI